MASGKYFTFYPNNLKMIIELFFINDQAEIRNKDK